MSTGSLRNWKTIWDGRRVAPVEDDLLSALIVADGCDTGFGSYPPEDWKAMVANAAVLAGVGQGSRVLEIGCGAGAFLHELHRQTGCSVTGLDYSLSLIEEARRYLPFGEFVHAEATGVSALEGPFDAIFSHSVFIYFPDHAYVSRVLAAAFDRLSPGGVLCVQDLNDLGRKDDYEVRRRRTYRRPEHYDRDYAGLSHLYFDQATMIGELARLGFEAARPFEHASKGYANAEFRFNLIARKPGA
jgi:SAM-dependent methyltransferase